MCRWLNHVGSLFILTDSGEKCIDRNVGFRRQPHRTIMFVGACIAYSYTDTHTNVIIAIYLQTFLSICIAHNLMLKKILTLSITNMCTCVYVWVCLWQLQICGLLVCFNSKPKSEQMENLEFGNEIASTRIVCLPNEKVSLGI